jgi:hypothetical protein
MLKITRTATFTLEHVTDSNHKSNLHATAYNMINLYQMDLHLLLLPEPVAEFKLGDYEICVLNKYCDRPGGIL